ncbi:hypothetical protein CcaCcLH18_13176 [Colletotrichum camelliae]|nr:hypothetical protein CcaCcLH18_13176 [Colletotrichum camelliae]
MPEGARQRRPALDACTTNEVQGWEEKRSASLVASPGVWIARPSNAASVYSGKRHSRRYDSLVQLPFWAA